MAIRALHTSSKSYEFPELAFTTAVCSSFRLNPSTVKKPFAVGGIFTCFASALMKSNLTRPV